VTQAAPHYLIADGAPLAVRRTRGGDAWQARKDGVSGVGAGDMGHGTVGYAGLPGSVAGPGTAGAAAPVLLGMPARGRPAS